MEEMPRACLLERVKACVKESFFWRGGERARVDVERERLRWLRGELLEELRLLLWLLRRDRDLLAYLRNCAVSSSPLESF